MYKSLFYGLANLDAYVSDRDWSIFKYWRGTLHRKFCWRGRHQQ